MTDTQQIRNTIQSEASTYSKQETNNRGELLQTFLWGTAKTIYRVGSSFVTGPLDALFNSPKRTFYTKYNTGGFIIFILILIIINIDSDNSLIVLFAFIIIIILVMMLASALDDDILCKCDKK